MMTQKRGKSLILLIVYENFTNSLSLYFYMIHKFFITGIRCVLTKVRTPVPLAYAGFYALYYKYI
jgi:hypothetical protein